jgi:hypothetical protein
MRSTMFALAMLLVGATGAAAQTYDQWGNPTASVVPVIRPIVGGYIPTGDQRDALKDALLVGGQLGLQFAGPVNLTGTFGWVPSESKLTPSDNGINLFQYDLGLELTSSTSMGMLTSTNFRPFIGLGAGGRTYSFRDVDLTGKTYFAGYGALGGEFNVQRLAIRIEGRDYLSQFEGFTGGQSNKWRNDVALFAGLGFRLF